MSKMKFAVLLALVAGLTLSAAGRVILQNDHSNKGLRPGETRSNRAFPGPPGHSRGKKRGTLLNFRTTQNATDALNEVDAETGTDLIDRIIQNSDYKNRGGRSKLVQDLERDDDLGVFGRSDTYYQPAFVFPKNLGPDYPKYIWEAASHEAGHTMGLNHDGTATAGYWQGNSANYGAIMGAGYYSQLTVWDKGEYLGANNQEDDTAIISSKLGYIPNGNGNSIAAATPLNVSVSGSTATGTASGVVAQQNTPDVFKFSAGAGGATVNVKTVIPWSTTGWDRSDLDGKVDVYNSASTLIASINPAGMDTTNGLGVSNAAVTLPAAGTYYLAVSGAGLGAANTDTGYSSYGVRGQFALTVTYPAPAGGTTPPPAPSPSPVATPSPPPPVASPSPSPAPTTTQGMSVQATMACSYTGTNTSKVYTCTATVTVKSTSGVLISGASVTGRYTTKNAATGFPTAYYTSTTGTDGKATMTTAPSAPYAAGSETFTVTSVTKTGYTWTGPLSVTLTFT